MMNFSMSSAMNAMNAVGANAGKVAANGAPADPAQAPDGALLPGLLPDTAAPLPAAQVLPFQHWIAADGALAATDAAAPVDDAAPGVAPEELAAERPDDGAIDAGTIDAALAALSMLTPQLAPAGCSSTCSCGRPMPR